jgi:NodT family efflux transporter outer membrane factor (OMF) lipoprotein
VNLGRFTPALLSLALLAASCSLAPPYHVPESSPVPAQYQELDGWKPAAPMDELPRGNWWRLFNDPQLDNLEIKAAAANQNLKAAYARLQQARAETRIARADLFPTITASAFAERARTSPNSPRFPPGDLTTGNDFNLEGDFSYELDFWGRVRNEVASAKAGQQASAADLASLTVSIQAEVATDYFNLRSDDTQQLLVDHAVADYRQALQLTQNLYDAGAVPLGDVAQAQTQLENAMTQAADIHLLRAQAAHAIAVLVGENPSAFGIPVNSLPLDLTPPGVNTDLPSALLERRPDVAEAERRVAAANAQIGVARAAYFPQFSLDASAGLNSTRASNWLSAPSRFWSFGPQLTVPIFEGGRLLAQTERARAQYSEQVAQYRNTVLTAYQNVEDSLAALRQLEQEAQTAAAAVMAAGVALQQAQYRYNAGAVTYLEVSSAETTALQTQLGVADIQTRRFNATVMLIKALGGGWQVSDPLMSHD